MSKRRNWLIVMACVVLAITLVLVVKPSGEPRYEGRSLSEWLLDISGHYPGTNPRTEKAYTAIRAIGTNAIPHLLEFITYEPKTSRVRTVLKWVRNRLPGYPKTKSPSWRPNVPDVDLNVVRKQAVPFAFEALGASAAPAIPRLEQLMQNQTNNIAFWMATWSLAAISTNAQPVLLSELASQNPEQRAYAAHAFGLFSMARINAEPVVPLLVDAVEDKDMVARYYAVWALGEIDPSSDEARSALTKALEDPKASVRRVATNALLKIAPEILTNAPPQ